MELQKYKYTIKTYKSLIVQEEFGFFAQDCLFAIPLFDLCDESKHFLMTISLSGQEHLMIAVKSCLRISRQH
jgi:hypothetical protein